MKKLYGFLFVCIIFIFCIACVNGHNYSKVSTQYYNIFLTPNDHTQKPKDTRPKVYNVYTNNGIYEQSFASLYQGIDYVIQNLELGAYIKNTNYPDQKVFFLVPKPHYFVYQNGTTLDDIVQWDSVDNFNLTQNTIAICTALFPSYHSYQFNQDASSDTQQLIYPDLDAYAMYENTQTLKINLSQSKIYPSYSQPVYAQLGFVIYVDRFAYFAGLVCDTSNGNWYYCFYNLDNPVISTDLCVMVSDFKNGCFVPQDDIILSIDSVPFSDNGQNYLKNLITLKFSQNRQYYFQNTLAGDNYKTNFIATLDIQHTQIPDYMNGAQWQNIVIQKLQANTKNALIYNTAVTKHLDQGNQDILGFDYNFDTSAPAHSPKIADVQKMIDNLYPSTITLDDRKNIQETLKAYNSLPDILQSLIKNTHKLRLAQSEIYNLYQGLEKSKAIAQDLKPVLDADNGYIIDNFDIIFQAWDILFNQTPEPDQENFSQYYKTKITAYYHKALNLYMQATDARMAIEEINPKSTKAQIVQAYEKYVILDEAQKQKILGQELCANFEKTLKKIDQGVLDVVAQIIDLGYCDPANYAVVYGINNYQKMQILVSSYQSLKPSQKKLIPPNTQKIYQTASEYFNNQINNLKELKSSIQKTPNPSQEQFNNWLKIYKNLDIGSKYSFQHDYKFGGHHYYQKFCQAAASFDIKI